MSHLLSTWLAPLHPALALQPNTFDQEFSTGYKLGLLLSMHNLTNINEFYNNKTTEATLQNFEKLEPILRSIGIRLSANVAVDIINGKAGTASKLLYQLKVYLNQAKLFPTQPEGSEPNPSAQITLPQIESSTIIKPASEHTTYEEYREHVQKMIGDKEHFFFAQQLRLKGKQSGRLPTSDANTVSNRRTERQSTGGTNRYTTSSRSDPTQEDKIELSKRIKLNTMKKQERKKLETKSAEMPSFMKKATPSVHPDSSGTRRGLPQSSSSNSLDDLILELPDQPSMAYPTVITDMENFLDESGAEETEKYIADVRIRAAERSADRKAKEARRRQLIQEESDDLTRSEQEESQRVLLSRLLLKSQAEKRLADQLAAIHMEKDIIRMNREFREQQYISRRQKDYEESLAREGELGRLNRLGNLKAEELQIELHKQSMHAKYAAKHEKHTKICSHIVHQIVLLSEKIWEYKHLASDSVPTKLMREWKLCFEKGVAFDPSDDREAIQSVREITEEENENIALLDDDEFQTYLRGENEWAYVDSKPVVNNGLAKIVDIIISLTTKIPEDIISPILPAISLKVLILGRSLSGKQTLAHALAADGTMELIDMELILQNSMEDDKKIKISEEAFVGKPIDDEKLVALIVDAIRSNETKNWILVDFPKTKAQAMLLEKELGGYQEPRASKSGNMKRTDAVASAKEKPSTGKKRSAIAPLPADTKSTSNVPLESMFDLAFLLDIDNETSISRATAKRTGAHTNVSQRITKSATSKQEAKVDDALGQKLSFFSEYAEDLESWYDKFGILKKINGAQPIKSVQSEVSSILSVVAEAKKLKLSKDPEGEEGRSMMASRVAKDKEAGKLDGEPLGPKEDIETSTNSLRPTSSPKRLVPPDCAELLMNQWCSIETAYTASIKHAIRNSRKEFDGIVRYLSNTKSAFHAYMNRPDTKQSIVSAFIKDYNAIEDNFRSETDVKAELHHRLEDVKERLWEICDERKEEAEIERTAILDERWTEDHLQMLANIHINMIEAELLRSAATKQLVIDFFKESGEVRDPSQGQTFAEETVELPKVPYSEPSQFTAESMSISNGTIEKKETKKAIQRDPTRKPTITKQTQGPSTVTATVGAEVDDSGMLQDLLHAFNVAIASVDKSADDVDDKKKKVVPEEPPAEDTDGLNLKEILSAEDNLIRARLDRLRSYACDLLKEAKSRSRQTFTSLEEMISSKFMAEMAAIKDLSDVLKEAIEAECLLNNDIILDNDRFLVKSGSALPANTAANNRSDSPGGEESIPTEVAMRLIKHLSGYAPAGFIPKSTLSSALNRAENKEMDTEEVENKEDKRATDRLLNWRLALYDQLALPEISTQEILKIREAYQCLDLENKGFVTINEASSVLRETSLSMRSTSVVISLWTLQPDQFHYIPFLLACCQTKNRDIKKMVSRHMTVLSDPLDPTDRISTENALTVLEFEFADVRESSRSDKENEVRQMLQRVAVNNEISESDFYAIYIKMDRLHVTFDPQID